MSNLAPTPSMVLPRRPAPVPIESGDQRIVIRGVDRELYNRLDEAIGEGQHVRLAYDGKDLELMTTGHIHESFKMRMGTFVGAVTAGLDVDHLSAGQTTESDRGLEADQSYYFDPEKLRVARAALARRSMDLADYPKLDMAIEIDISRSQVDRPSIYKALRVAEVWRFNGITLVIEQLQPDGSYVRVEVSRFLPIPLDEVVAWLTADDALLETAWNRRLYQWAMGLGRQA
jgi:Putative restriction endonuclease